MELRHLTEVIWIMAMGLTTAGVMIRELRFKDTRPVLYTMTCFIVWYLKSCLSGVWSLAICIMLFLHGIRNISRALTNLKLNIKKDKEKM